MKQSSIEWLVTELNQMIDYIPLSKWDKIADIIQQAKQMHKEEIVRGCVKGYLQSSQEIHFPLEDAKDYAEEYYQETYGGNNE